MDERTSASRVAPGLARESLAAGVDPDATEDEDRNARRRGAHATTSAELEAARPGLGVDDRRHDALTEDLAGAAAVAACRADRDRVPEDLDDRPLHERSTVDAMAALVQLGGKGARRERSRRVQLERERADLGVLGRHERAGLIVEAIAPRNGPARDPEALEFRRVAVTDLPREGPAVLRVEHVEHALRDRRALSDVVGPDALGDVVDADAGAVHLGLEVERVALVACPAGCVVAEQDVVLAGARVCPSPGELVADDAARPGDEVRVPAIRIRDAELGARSADRRALRVRAELVALFDGALADVRARPRGSGLSECHLRPPLRLPRPRGRDLEPTQDPGSHEIDLPHPLGLEPSLADPATHHLHVPLDPLGDLLRRQVLHASQSNAIITCGQRASPSPPCRP
ncbi:MAG: hypothetical protein M3T56_10355 [Chloroflexota bacterium]|nr:hypothetical protein [Chloroflexota bacterium]